MRARLGRVFSAVVITAVAAVAMSGCAGVDLASEWPSMATPTGWEPKSGACTGSFSDTSYRSAYTPVDCAKSHGYETVHIGTFTGDAAAAAVPPGWGSSAMGAAWAECDAKTTEYVGAPWRDGRIWISVSLPSAGSWQGGARWFRCEVATTDERFGNKTPWTGSLKGELAKETRLKVGCYVVPKASADPWDEVECTEEHNAEYVGTFISTDSRDEVLKDTNTLHRKCLSIVATYAGVPDDGMMKYRSGTAYAVPSARDWEAGDHGVRCHLYLNKKLTKSFKSAGNKGLPINYA